VPHQFQDLLDLPVLLHLLDLPVLQHLLHLMDR
jgi:hypothetical protein